MQCVKAEREAEHSLRKVGEMEWLKYGANYNKPGEQRKRKRWTNIVKGHRTVAAGQFGWTFAR